ncbi:TOG array regulator of axonemal microtubules protein 1 isoform X2 [Macrobrachium rosenbergii]|uniref:TOG array regulator of axonemal microtubules protein 1 isoform X2 n=1 Tax=Macrobrachium rosenbergii TaxID=79674 RepID=UPI0034D67CD0
MKTSPRGILPREEAVFYLFICRAISLYWCYYNTMATYEDLRRPGDLIEASPKESLLSSHSAYMPSTVGQTPDVREVDSYARASSNLSASQGKESLQSMQLLHSRQSSAMARSSSSKNSNHSKMPSSAVRSRLSKYAMTPSLTKNSSVDAKGKRKSSVDARQVQEELELPSDKTDFIISLKKELKKHHTIPITFNKLGLFEELNKLLSDDVWEIRNECTLLIRDLLPHLKNDLDSCLTIVLPHIIPNLSSSRAAILQNSSVQLIKTYAHMTRDRHNVVEDLISFGIQNKSNSVSKGTIENLPNILNDRFADEDLSYLSECLFRKLHDVDLRPSVLVSLKQLQYLVGQEEFERYVNRLTPRSRQSVNRLFEKAGLSSVSYDTIAQEEEAVDADDENEDDDTEGNDGSKGDEKDEKELNVDSENVDGDIVEKQAEDDMEKDNRNDEVESYRGEKEADDDKEEGNLADVDDDEDEQVVMSKDQEDPERPKEKERAIQRQDSRTWVEFGVVDGSIMEKIRNETDWKTRSEGCERLRDLMRSVEDISPLLPHLPHFLALLDSLVDDYNFRISMTVLDIFRILIEKLDSKLPQYLKQIVHSVVKHVGDSKVVVRIENMRVFQKLLQQAKPAVVIPILCDNLSPNRSSRVREDSLNLIIYALMTFPSYEFDLNYLAEKVGPTVADPKRRVRQASLECISAIAQFLGPAKLGPLMAAVDRVEDEEDADGAMAAVQARLARRKLPRVSPDGLIEHSITIPANARRTKLSLPKGADIDWVLAGAGSNSGSGSILSAVAGRAGTASGAGGALSLSSSFTASDSQVHTLTSSYPLSSPFANSRMVLDEGLNRKRSISDVSLNRSSSRPDERGLALWTTDTIDLSRTAPSDLGAYRGVYLGKFRQGSSYARSIAVDKGFAILPNKYANSAIGSARGERVGTAGAGGRSPLLVSPTPQRRINALAPLEGSDAIITVSRAGSTRSVIPPLSAVSGRRQQKGDLPSDPEEELGEDGEVEEEGRSEYSYEYDDDDEEEEEVEEVLIEDDAASRSLKSSATTRDSGISVFSASNEGDIITENRKSSRRSSSRPQRSLKSKGSTDSLSSEERGRSSYDHAGRKADLTSPSTHSLPNEILRPNGFGVVGKSLSGTRSQLSKSRVSSRQSPGYEKDFRNFDYESDFETDDEDHNITISNTTLSKIKLLKKQKENMKEVERRRQERDKKKIQEERARKYRQLEIQHSQNSLQPSKPSSGDTHLIVGPNVSYKGRSPEASPLHSSNPSQEESAPRQPFSRAMPKSKSHNSNLNKSLGPPNKEKRHRSLERRISPQNARETFRTPQLVRRGQPPGGNTGNSGLNNSLGSSNGSNSFSRRNYRRPTERKTYKAEVPEKRAAIQPTHSVEPHSAPERIGPVGQQRPQLKHHLAPQMSAESRSSDDLSMSMGSLGMRSAKPASSCFKNHLEPFPNPQEALKNAQQLVNAADWENQMEGIQDIVRLNEHHAEVLQSDLHSVNLALLKQAKNLRSQVSRASIQAFTRLFDNLQRNMEPDVDKIANILLHRTSDTNKFLQLDSHHALDALVENISPNKAIPVIIQEGIGHKNAVVRTTVARLLAYEVERLGASRVLSGQKDITDRLLPAAAKLAQEGSLETRKYAKQLFQMLIRHGSFDAALKKHVPANEIRNIQKFLDNLSGEGRTVQESARSKFSVGGSRFTRTM